VSGGAAVVVSMADRPIPALIEDGSVIINEAYSPAHYGRAYVSKNVNRSLHILAVANRPVSCDDRPAWPVSTDPAGAIARLRTRPALAEPDLVLMNPNTWASVRTAKDGYRRFLASVDPTTDKGETVRGVDVLTSTQFTAGEAVLVDTTLVGRSRSVKPLSLRIGYTGGDFTNNILRTVCEERLNFAIERPAAIWHITGLPTAAPAEAKTTTRE
jgi:Phage capsid family